MDQLCCDRHSVLKAQKGRVKLARVGLALGHSEVRGQCATRAEHEDTDKNSDEGRQHGIVPEEN